MKVTTVIPNFNRIAKLKRAVDSVLKQTYVVDEIIIVDDCSTEKVQNTLKYCFKNIKKIKLIFNQTNMGASYSRNAGVLNANNKLIAFLDSDDIWADDKLEKQIKLISKKKDIHMVYCAQDGITLYRGNVLDKLLDGWIAPNPSTLVFKKTIYSNLNGFDESLQACEDHDFWFRFSEKGYFVDYVDEELTTFTNDADNRLSHDYVLRIEAAKIFLKKWQIFISENRGKGHYKIFYSNYIITVLYPIIINNLKQFKFFSCLKIYLKYFYLDVHFYNRLIKYLKKKMVNS